jgi:ribonuclease HII
MPDFHFESIHRAAGRLVIAGVDEAGRGPLAGPVVAGAVILPDDFSSEWLDDSKKLTEARRERLYEELTQDSRVRWASGRAEVAEIDRLNILRATHLAMRRAVAALGKPEPQIALIDGLPVRDFPWPQEAIVKGDGLSLSIAAASIIAKVGRDRIMLALDKLFPDYQFARHKGYGTAAHLAALQKHGPSPHHRRSFQPVAQLSLDFGGSGDP